MSVDQTKCGLLLYLKHFQLKKSRFMQYLVGFRNSENLYYFDSFHSSSELNYSNVIFISVDHTLYEIWPI